MPDAEQNRSTPSLAVRGAKLLLILAGILLLNTAGGWVAHQVDFQLYPRHEPALHLIILGSFALFIFLMAMPFMPGIEIGLALMLFLGGKGVLWVYLCTLVALSGSFFIGRKIPPRHFAKILDWLYLRKARDLVLQMEPLGAKERVSLLNAKAPSKIAPFLLNHRYLTIALLLNLPGNALLGGGGGIGLVAGMSRIISFPRYFLVLAVAISPVPISIFLRTL